MVKFPDESATYDSRASEPSLPSPGHPSSSSKVGLWVTWFSSSTFYSGLKRSFKPRLPSSANGRFADKFHSRIVTFFPPFLCNPLIKPATFLVNLRKRVSVPDLGMTWVELWCQLVDCKLFLIPSQTQICYWTTSFARRFQKNLPCSSFVLPSLPTSCLSEKISVSSRGFVFLPSPSWCLSKSF